MAPKILGAQRDFSSGEIDVALKRADDHPARKTGLRQMANMRVLNSAAIQNRPGRSALFPISGNCTRIEEFTISPGHNFKIGLGAGRLQFISTAGTVVNDFTTIAGTATALPWTLVNLNNVVYAIFGLSVYVTFAGMRPQVYTWDGVSTWSVANYTELVSGTQKRTPFYRISPAGISISPSGQTGAISIGTSVPIFTAAHIGTRIRFVGRQILLTGYVDATHMNALVEESLPGSQTIGFASDPSATFAVGDEVLGSNSGSRGLITLINAGSKIIVVQLLNQNISATSGIFGPGSVFAFTVGDTIVGPGGAMLSTAANPVAAPSLAATWDEEIMNDLRGYPASCFVDQYRLGFCNLPGLPNGILWSAINAPTDLYANDASSPSNAIFELAPDKVQVFYVVPGAESSEFVFCDRKLYYIKIDASNPLKPGSVGFQILSSDGCAQVQPRASEEIIVYANAGRNSMMAIIAPGNYYRPFNTKNLSEFHGHLFDNITAIAMPNADGAFNERYAYVMNGDNSLVVGKYTVKDGDFAGTIGWGPWSSNGALSWVAAWDADVLFTSSYFGTRICEILDDTQYLDAALIVNSLPTAFAAPVGKGPLWWIPSQTVSLMDQVTRSMGTYQIDANGFIIPQFSGGENLSIASLVSGQPWTAIIEPFCPDASPGADVHQRMFKRRISRFACYVVHSTGFLMARLFSGPATRTSPALGTVMNTHRVTAWNQDDDATLPPPLRETAERWRPLGRAFDPRVAIIKDTPGPMQILEIGIEASI
jgi:hypothetical protein